MNLRVLVFLESIDDDRVLYLFFLYQKIVHSRKLQDKERPNLVILIRVEGKILLAQSILLNGLYGEVIGALMEKSDGDVSFITF